MNKNPVKKIKKKANSISEAKVEPGPATVETKVDPVEEAAVPDCTSSFGSISRSIPYSNRSI